jgi:hypothetical protein
MRKTGLLLAAVTGTVLIGAGYAHAGVIDHETFKGTFAFANFSIDTPETCADGTAGILNTFVNVSGAEARTSSRMFPNTSTNNLSVSINIFDSCTGFGSLVFGSIDGGFSASTTRTATLTGTVPLIDDQGNAAGSATVALSLKRSLITSVSNDHSKEIQLDQSDGTTLIVQEHETGKSAEATATGSLVVNGVQFIGGFTSGGIVLASSGSVDIKKQ